MNKKYIKIPIGELADIHRGASPRPIDSWMATTGIPWVKISDATSSDSRYIIRTEKYIKTEGKEKSVEVFPGDLIISNSATPALPRIMKIHACIHDGWLLANNFNGITRDYLFYAIKYFHQFLINQGNGSIFKNLKIDILKEFEVYIPITNDGKPDIDYQNKVVNILLSIDEKIENNNKINAELEGMAKTIYDYWFLQFEFPNEYGKPYKSSGGKILWNEELKREIPYGWENKRIVDIEDNIVTGKTPSSNVKEYYNGDIPFITIGDIRDNMYVVSTEKTLTYEGANTQKNKFIPKDSICVTCIATPGMVGFSTKESQTNQQINSIIPKNKENCNFLYFAIKEYFIHSSGAKTGNTFANMNKEDFSNIKLIYNKDIIKKYYESTKEIFMKIKQNLLENQELASLRDFLLPMLMNGQVTFKEFNYEINIKDIEEKLKEKI